MLPGYIATKILRNIGGLKRRISETELLYTSLIYSTIIYFILGFLFRKNDYDALKNEVLKPYNVPIVLITTALVGAFFGIILYVWRRYAKGIVPDDCWTSVLHDYVSDDAWIVVYTRDGKEYKGALGYFGIEHEPRELTIVEPYRIRRDDKFKLIEDVFLGAEIYFTDKDILRILFMERESIIHELKNIPPYTSEGDLSTIVVKNRGYANARILSTCVNFDWDDNLMIELDYEFDENKPYILSQNDEKIFHKSLPSPPTKGKHFIEIRTYTCDSDIPYSAKFGVCRQRHICARVCASATGA